MPSDNEKKIPSRKQRKKLKKKYLDFEEFKKDFKEANGFIERMFDEVAMLSGIQFTNVAKSYTKEDKLVDTGYYRRNWSTDILKTNNEWKIKCFNPVEYASFLEYGHKTLSGGRVEGKFVGTRAMKEAEEFAVKELKKRLGDLYKEK